ncbi:MAG: type II toxin-antitoxin system Phd/YefM family antitoxin [Planctomycetota bacterium]
MAKRTMIATVPAYVARTQLRSLLREVSRKRARFVITKSGKPTVVLLSVTDLDDILEELDPEFQESLRVEAREHRRGRTLTLKDYLESRISHRTRQARRGHTAGFTDVVALSSGLRRSSARLPRRGKGRERAGDFPSRQETHHPGAL